MAYSTILLIEDDSAVRERTASFLRRSLGANVIQAESASRAIAVLTSFDVDMVISDYGLSGMGTGKDVLAWIRRERPKLEERFVFLSGYDCSQVHKYSIAKGSPASEQLAYLTNVLAGGTLAPCPT